MTKYHRLTKAWQRNWEFYMHKGVYFIMGTPVKKWMTPKDLCRYLRKEDRLQQEWFKKYRRNLKKSE